MIDRSAWNAALSRAVASVPETAIERAVEVLIAADIVLTAGNGGSSSLASHAAQALLKPAYKPGGGIAAVCLTDNTPSLTAHANDAGWDNALVEAARPFLDAIPLCVPWLISSSGRSENIVRLARLGQERGCPIVAMTGFAGEPLRGLATISLHVESDDYEIIEPAHDALIHRLQARVRLARSKA